MYIKVIYRDCICIHLLSNAWSFTSHLFHIRISCITPPHNLLQHILNSHHTTSTFPRCNFSLLGWNIWATSFIPIAIVVLVEVIFIGVVPILDILTLKVVITIAQTLVSLTLAPIILIGTFGIWWFESTGLRLSMSLTHYTQSCLSSIDQRIMRSILKRSIIEKSLFRQRQQTHQP